MKFTEMVLNEGAGVDTSELYNFKPLNVPLSDIKIRKPGTMELIHIPSEIIEGLANARVKTTEDFKIASERGNLKEIEYTKNVGADGKDRTMKLGQTWVDAINNGILDSISQLPGMADKDRARTYAYLKDKMGISTLTEYDNEYAKGTFDDLNVPDANLTYDDFEKIRILSERRGNESLMRVYHTSVDINVAKYVFDHTWGDGPNSQMYGTGLYTCWTKRSAFEDIDLEGNPLGIPKSYYRDNAIRQGKHFNIDMETGERINFRFEFLVNVKNYFNFRWSLFKETNSEEVEEHKLNEHNFLAYQAEKFGLHDVPHSKMWFVGFEWKNPRYNPNFVKIGSNGKIITKDGKPCIEGTVFNGGNDGDVVIAYDSYHAIPTRLSKGSANKWYKIGGQNYLDQARQAAMGIAEGGGEFNMADFWKMARQQYLKTIEDIFNNHNGAEDMNETEFISSDGKNVSIIGSVETGVIEGPEARESNTDGVFDNYTVQDCYQAKSIHLPFRSVKNLTLTNKIPADCSMLTSLAANSRLDVQDTAIIENLPNASLPWSMIVGGSTGNAKIRIKNTNVGPNTQICNFQQAYFINMDLEKVLILADDDHIRFRNFKANNIYIYLDAKDTIQRITFENCDIKNVHFKASTTSKSVEKIEIDTKTATNDLTFHFDVKTDHHRSIYKEDDEVIQSAYSAEDLFAMLIEHDDTLPEKDEFIEQSGFNIKDIRIGDIK